MGTENEKKEKKSFIDRLKTDKKLLFAVMAVLIVLIVFMFSGILQEKKDAKTTEGDAISDYVCGLENRLTDILSNVSGVGKVRVAITVDSGIKTVLASKTTITETNGGKETVETPLVINGKTVVIKEVYPKASGVLIVAEGAGNIMVYKRIQQATLSFLGVDLNKIEILTMK